MGIWVIKIFFYRVLLHILATSFNHLCFYLVLTISILYHSILAWNNPLLFLTFLKRSPVFPILLFSSAPLHCSFKSGHWLKLDSLVAQMVKNLPIILIIKPEFDSWVGRIPWRKKWQPTPVFLHGKSHGQRSLVGYCPWGRKRVGHDWGMKQQLWKRVVPK